MFVCVCECVCVCVIKNSEKDRTGGKLGEVARAIVYKEDPLTHSHHALNKSCALFVALLI